MNAACNTYYSVSSDTLGNICIVNNEGKCVLGNECKISTPLNCTIDGRGISPGGCGAAKSMSGGCNKYYTDSGYSITGYKLCNERSVGENIECISDIDCLE